MKKQPHQKGWVASAKAESVVQAAIATARFAVTSPELDVLPRYRIELLHNVLWLATVAPSGKYTTRFRSVAAVKDPRATLRHEHVYTRKSLVERMRADPDSIEVVLRDLAIGCTVTKEEHDRLRPFDKSHDGWDRYREAGVDVVDMETEQPFIINGEYVHKEA